jgi:hypothetical protein
MCVVFGLHPVIYVYQAGALSYPEGQPLIEFFE